MPFTSKRQQRAAFGGHIPGFSKEKAKEWAKETPDMKGLPERAPAEKGKHTLRAKKAELAHAHDSGKGLSEAAIARGVKVELEHTKDPGVARQIAIDHLRERPDYYARLADAEKSTMRKKSSLQNQSQAHTNYFVEMNLAKLASGAPVAPVLGERRRSAGVGDNIPPQTDFAQAVEGDPVKAAADDRAGRISDRIDDVGIGLLAAPYAASLAGHGLAKSKNPKLRAAGAALERGLGTESRFGKSHGRELAGLAMVAPGVTHTMAKGINKVLPKEKGAADDSKRHPHQMAIGGAIGGGIGGALGGHKFQGPRGGVVGAGLGVLGGGLLGHALDRAEHAPRRKQKRKHAADQTVLSDHSDPPGYMMVQNLNRLTDQSKQLAKAVSVKDNAEPWVESKIDRASEALDAVHDYMKYKTKHHEPNPKHASVDFFLKIAKEVTTGPSPASEKRASLSVNIGLRAINAHVQRERERERDLIDAFYESQKHAGLYKLSELESQLGFEKYASLEKFASQMYPDYEYMTEMEKVAVIGRIFNMFGRGAGAAGRGAAAAARGAGAASKAVSTQVGHIGQGLAEGGKMFAQVPGEIGAGLRAGGQTFREAGRGIAQSVGGAASNVAQTGRGALATAGDAVGRAQTGARLNFRAGQRGTTISPERIDLVHNRARRLADFRAANPAMGPVQPTRMQRVGDQLSAMRQGIGDRFSALRQGASNQLGAAREGIANQFGAAREGIANRVSAAREGIANRVGAAREGISNASQRVGDRMQALREGIGQRFSAAGQRIGEMGQGLREGAGNLAQAVRERAGGLGRITERQRAALGEQLGAFKQKTRDSLAAFRERGRAAQRGALPAGSATGGAMRAEQALAAEGRAATATGGAAAPAAASPAATPATASGATPVTAAATPASAAVPVAATGGATPATPAATPAPATAPATAPAAAPAPPVTQAAAPAASPAATPAAAGGATPVPAAAAPAAAEAAAAEGAKKPGMLRRYGLPLLGVGAAGLGVGGVTAAYGLKSLANAGNEDHGPLAGPAYVGPGRGF